MRLYYIANVRMPTEKAHGLQIMKTCGGLVQAGVEVELVVPRRHNTIIEDPFTYYGIARRFTITRLPTIDLVRFGLPFAFALQTLAFAYSVARFLAEKNTKDARVYVRGDIGWMLPLTSRRAFIWENHIPPKKRRNEARAVARASGIVTVTQAYKEDLMRDYGLPSERIHVAPDGVDLETLDISLSKKEARERLGLPQGMTIAMYTGHLRTMGKDKGTKDVLRALQILKEHKTPVFFVAVGGSDTDRAYYERMARELGVDEFTRFDPRVSFAQLAVYQKAADMLLLPFPREAHYARYMSPMKLFEYMASGRPIIATRLPSLEEILSQQNAVFVEPGDPTALAAALAHLPADADHRAAQALVDAHRYTWDKRAEGIATFAQSLPENV